MKSPGVHVTEINAFGNSVVPVATAIPAFIGYTPQASYDGRSYHNVPQKISSFTDFKAIYCYPDQEKQYSPQYYLVKQQSLPEKGDYVEINGNYYSIVPDPNTIYYLYNSIKLFYDNGGGDAYIVSIGSYGPPSGQPMTTGDQIVNPNVQLTDLTNGLALLKKEQEPTMYICTEATLLSVADSGTLMQTMLLQNQEMGTAISLFDVIGGRNPDPTLYTDDIQTFRNSVGSEALKYGATYYPFVGTTIMQKSDIDYTNLFGGDSQKLAAILNPADAPNHAVSTVFDHLDAATVQQNQTALLNVSPAYASIMQHILADVNLLPPTGALAGVITVIDSDIGPWQAPANRSIVGAVSLPIKLSSTQQENLNVDAVSGKSVNAIRFFNGQGILIWGARTLDGNSVDWKYISIRRTMTFLEQSCQLALRTFAFEPNDKNTWETVISMISNFLTGVWKDGALQGARASDAFTVACGLGSTMTADDILNGFMRVTVKVAITHPAEFIVFTLVQEMSKS